jgi:hypothetical protein
MIINEARLNELLRNPGNAKIKMAIDRTTASKGRQGLSQVKVVPADQLPHGQADNLSELAQIAEMLRAYVARVQQQDAAKAEAERRHKEFEAEFRRNNPSNTRPEGPKVHALRKQELRSNPVKAEGVFAGVLSGNASMAAKGSGEGFAGTIFKPGVRKGQTEPVPNRLASALETARRNAEFREKHGPRIKRDSLADVFGSSMR